MSARGARQTGTDERDGHLVVLGVGNPILSDDGAGVEALAAISAADLPAGVRLIDAGVAGPLLLDAVAGCDGLLVLDAVDVGGRPGEVVRVDLGAEGAPAMPRNAHALGLETLLQDLRVLGEYPARAVLFGVQPASVALGTGLSPPVATALPKLVRAALNELRQWARASTERHAARGKGDVGVSTEDER